MLTCYELPEVFEKSTYPVQWRHSNVLVDYLIHFFTHFHGLIHNFLHQVRYAQGITDPPNGVSERIKPFFQISLLPSPGAYRPSDHRDKILKRSPLFFHFKNFLRPCVSHHPVDVPDRFHDKHRTRFRGLNELLFEPLGLTSTYLHIPDDSKAAAPAPIYYKDKSLHLDRAMASFGPDGGLVSCVEDLLTFMRAFIEGKLFKNSETLTRMQTWNRIFFPFQYGLGLMRFKLPRFFSPFSPTPELIGHSGASGSFLFYCPKAEIYLAGTLNQLADKSKPIRLILEAINIVTKNSS